MSLLENVPGGAKDDGSGLISQAERLVRRCFVVSLEGSRGSRRRSVSRNQAMMGCRRDFVTAVHLERRSRVTEELESAWAVVSVEYYNMW